jgi:ABC-type molybdate transport system permease subunit
MVYGCFTHILPLSFDCLFDGMLLQLERSGEFGLTWAWEL